MGIQDGNVEITLTVNPQGMIVGISKAGTAVAGQGNKMERALQGVETQSRQTTQSLGGLVKAAAGLFIFGKVAGVIRDSVRAAGEAALAQAKVEAAIKSTGGAAGVTFASLEEMAKGLQKVTTFEDDAILAGQSMLLTFTKIGKNVFPQATETILNMSTAMGSDLKSAAIQLGKALNEPVEGISALSRVGVQMTKEQEAMIKAFVRLGDIESAQKIILGELEVQMGGLARATAKTGTGPLLQFRNMLGDIQEELGNQLLPVLIDSAKKVQAFLASAKESGKLEAAFQKFAQAAAWAVQNVDMLIRVGSGLIAVFAVEKLLAIGAAIRGIGLAIAANPAMAAIAVAGTAAVLTYQKVQERIESLEKIKFWESEAGRIKSANLELEKHKSVQDAVEAARKRMMGQSSSPFPTVQYQPGAGAAKVVAQPKPKLPLTDEQIKANEKRAKETLTARHAFEDSQVALIQNKTEQQLQALDLRFERERVALGTNQEAITLLGQAYHNQEKVILEARAKEISDLRLAAAVELNLGLDAENQKQIEMARNLAQAHKVADQEVIASKFGLAQAVVGAFGKLTGASKAAFLASKAVSAAQIWVSTLTAEAQALATPPGPPWTFPLAAKVLLAGKINLASLAATTVAGFEDGGIVPGNSTRGDRVPALVNSREMILNQRQQANLFAMANGQGGGGAARISVSIGDIVVPISGSSSLADAREMGAAAGEAAADRLQRIVDDIEEAQSRRMFRQGAFAP